MTDALLREATIERALKMHAAFHAYWASVHPPCPCCGRREDGPEVLQVFLTLPPEERENWLQIAESNAAQLRSLNTQ